MRGCRQLVAQYTILLLSYAYKTFAQSGDTSKPQPPLTGPLYDKIKPGNYDRFRAPSETAVRLRLFVNSISAFTDENMDFHADVTLVQSWKDSRLGGATQNFMDVHPAYFSLLWTPPLRISNYKAGGIQTVIQPSRHIQLWSAGQINIWTHLTVKLSCNEVMRYHPMENQICSVIIDSFAFGFDFLQVDWDGDTPVQVADDSTGGQFRFLDSSIATQTYTGLKYTLLHANFTLQRRMGYNIYLCYMPSTLIVCLSWLTFLIHPDATIARMVLSIIHCLSLVSLYTGVKLQRLGDVLYVTALNVWLGVCFLFCLATLLEFVCVNTFREHEKVTTSYTKEFPRRQSVQNALRSFRIDKISRRVFPILFIVFVVIYLIVNLVLGRTDS